jgi:hypothetical protein
MTQHATASDASQTRSTPIDMSSLLAGPTSEYETSSSQVGSRATGDASSLNRCNSTRGRGAHLQLKVWLYVSRWTLHSCLIHVCLRRSCPRRGHDCRSRRDPCQPRNQPFSCWEQKDAISQISVLQQTWRSRVDAGLISSRRWPPVTAFRPSISDMCGQAQFQLGQSSITRDAFKRRPTVTNQAR